MDIGDIRNMTNAALCTNGGMTYKLATIAVYMLGFFFIVFLCNFLHILLRPSCQPRIISECIVGLFLSNLPMIRKHTQGIQSGLQSIVEVAMVLHMFVVGLEVDPNIFLEIHLLEAKVAYSGVLTTFVIAAFLTPLLNIPTELVVAESFNLGLSVILSGTASPLLTRLITDFKIGKSDIGRFVVSAGVHTDLVSTLMICVGCIIFNPLDKFNHRPIQEMLTMVVILIFEMTLASKLTPSIMNWVNRENPDGKPMKCSHLIMTVAYVVMVCTLSPIWAGYDKVLSAFLAGVFMPREGRIAKMMISKVNYFFGAIFYPLFFFWVGTKAQLSEFETRKLGAWTTIFYLFCIATAGKVVGTCVSGVVLGLHWQDSIVSGLLLSFKGHFHVYLAIMSSTMEVTTTSTSIAMVFATFLTIIYTPLVVSNIIRRARKRSPTQRMALQWLIPSSELRILLCLNGPENVSSATNLIGISRGPVDPGILVFLTDMIELTDKIAATVAHTQGMDTVTVTVTDPEVVAMREKITNGVNSYLVDDGDGVTVKRMLALSTLTSMHQDICILAEDSMVSLIILPFHKQQIDGGRLNLGNSGFRLVNRKVLRHSPCSVGILVDRGLGSTLISRSTTSLHAAVIFIGGKDDREALSYAGRVAHHPGVKLTVIRFLLEASGDSVSSKITIAKSNSSEHQEEMKVDDECFADFYDRHVAGGYVAYMEKYLVNSGQTFSTLRSLEGQYGLFIVGRGGRVNSVLTVGMNDWEECPELGPIGDILSASDFSVTASVLVIQQHSYKGDLDGLEFSIM